MNVSWFFCFSVLLLIHTVSVQSVTVEGVIGQQVILPCSHEQNPKTVYWRDSDSRTVCDISGGKAFFTDQDPTYRDRVEVFPLEFEKGNFSIRLKNVKESDGGTYSCRVPNIHTLKIELIIKERQTTTDREETRSTTVRNTTKNGESRRRADGLLTFLLGCALIYSLVF